MVKPMERHQALELLRARAAAGVDPRLHPELRDALELDPELRAFAGEWGPVAEWTAALGPAEVESRLAFDDVRASIVREAHTTRWRWRWIAATAAAAVLAIALAVALAVAFAGRDGPARNLVELHSIALDAATPPEPELELPQCAASYAPTEDGAIRWLTNVDDGRAIARVAERPLLVFGSHPTCPWCQHMKHNGLRDPRVVALVDGFVAVEVDYSEIEPDQALRLFESGWPRWEIHSAAGALEAEFHGVHEAPEFIATFQRELERLSQPAPPSWESVRRGSSEYLAARAAEHQGHFADAERTYAALSRSNMPRALGEAARAGLARIAFEAHRSLIAARDSADPAAALERALSSFASTAFESDLARVRQALREHGSFPELHGGAD